MADSSITKKALAESLKQLMEEKPFEKINISDICDRCQMNRKSFYYHFKDKYDLVNWIFDTDILALLQDEVYEHMWDAVLRLSHYLYDNYSFYKKVLCITGQNSFPEHFQSLLVPLISNSIRDVLDENEVMEFQITFLSDAIVMAFQRWIIDNGTMIPEDFVKQLKLSLKYIALKYGDEE